MKRSRSKYFEYIEDDIIESSVISGTGVKALVPADWNGKKVKIMLSANDTDFYYSRCKKGKSRGFVPLPAYLAGRKILIKLIDLSEEEMKVPYMFDWLFHND